MLNRSLSFVFRQHLSKRSSLALHRVCRSVSTFVFSSVFFIAFYFAFDSKANISSPVSDISICFLKHFPFEWRELPQSFDRSCRSNSPIFYSTKVYIKLTVFQALCIKSFLCKKCNIRNGNFIRSFLGEYIMNKKETFVAILFVIFLLWLALGGFQYIMHLFTPS